MKVIIAGSRSINSFSAIENAVKASGFKITEVVCGMAPGVDLQGKSWAEANKIPVKEMPAKWNDLKAPGVVIRTGKYGKYNAKAGFDRNKDMANYAEALIAIWDSKSPGTADMIEAANKKKLKVYIWYM